MSKLTLEGYKECYDVVRDLKYYKVYISYPEEKGEGKAFKFLWLFGENNKMRIENIGKEIKL